MTNRDWQWSSVGGDRVRRRGQRERSRRLACRCAWSSSPKRTRPTAHRLKALRRRGGIRSRNRFLRRVGQDPEGRSTVSANLEKDLGDGIKARAIREDSTSDGGWIWGFCIGTTLMMTGGVVGCRR